MVWGGLRRVWGRVGDGAAGGGGEGGHAEVGAGVVAGADLVHLAEFVAGAGEADFESFGFAEPVVLLGFGDAVVQVGADGLQAGSLGGVGAQQRAAQAGVLVDAGGAERPAAGAGGDFAAGPY